MYVCSILYRQSNLPKSISPIPGVRGSYDFLELGQQPLILEAKELEFPDAPSGFFTYMIREPTKQVGVYIPIIKIPCCRWLKHLKTWWVLGRIPPRLAVWRLVTSNI